MYQISKKIYKIVFIMIKSISCLLLFGFLQAQAQKILLLQTYHQSLLDNHSLQGYLVSEKLDGVRAIWNGKNLITRNGIIIAAPPCFTQFFPPFKLDGELWTTRNDFANIVRIVKQKNPSCEIWKDMKYYVFDVIPNRAISSQECYKEHSTSSSTDSKKHNGDITQYCTLLSRLQIIKDYLTTHTHTTIRVLEYQQIASFHELESLLQNIVANKGEGLVIRKNEFPYEYGRSNNVLKLKLFQDSECKVVGYTQGKGKFSGKMGAIICEQSMMNKENQDNISNTAKSSQKQTQNISDRTRTIRFKIGTGFTKTMRDNPPKIGTIITYKFQGFNANGLPRFPVFLRLYQE